jgi:hypothetical protein
MEMDPNPSPLHLLTDLQVCCGCHPPPLLLCRRHPTLLLLPPPPPLALLPPTFAILEGTLCWAFHHQQDV